MRFISREDGEKMLDELAAARGITRQQLDSELNIAANKADDEAEIPPPPTDKWHWGDILGVCLFVLTCGLFFWWLAKMVFKGG